MPIGHCLAKNLYHAVQFCLLLDIMLIVTGLWGLNSYNTDDSIAETQTRLKVQTFAAMIGLVAAVIFKGAQKYMAIGVLFAVAGAAVFAFSAISEWAYASAVSKLADEGRVELSGLFWPSEMLQYVFILILVLNHLLLAHHGQQLVRERIHKPIPDDEHPSEVL